MPLCQKKRSRQSKAFMLACHFRLVWLMWNKRNKGRDLWFACQIRLIYSLLFNLFFLIHLQNSYCHLHFISFCLLIRTNTIHYYIIAASKTCSVTTTTAKVNLIFYQKRKTTCKCKKCQHCWWLTSKLMNQHT